MGGSDFGFAFGDYCRFRVSIFKQRGNVGMVLRQIPNKLLSFEQLGTPPIIKALCHRPRGLFLVTGPTGSGKSTTLASMIDYINDKMDHHIITIEDPIEFYHYHKKSTVNQREVGVDVPSFSEAIRRALRQDPDVILVGEMRDLATIEAAITAAETGHIVFGTLHTTGAQGTVNRIIDVFPTNQQEQIRVQLSMAIIGVLSQALLPKIGGGRVAAYEMLVVDACHRQPDSRKQNLPHQLGDSNRGQTRNAAARRSLVQALAGKKVIKEEMFIKANQLEELQKRIANAERGMFDDEADVERRARQMDKREGDGPKKKSANESAKPQAVNSH